MPIIENQGSKLYYEAHGSGYPVIFMHGGNGNTMAWYQQVPYFSRNYRVITVDLRGFKNSTCPPELVHPRFFPDDLRAIMDAEKLPEAALVCQSLGAWAGLPFAVKYPERVSCLFITGSPSPAFSEENWRTIDRAQEIYLGDEAKRNTEFGWNRQTIAERPAHVFLYSQIKKLNPLKFNSRTMQDDSVKLLPEHLVKYRIPTVVAGGAHDDFLNPRSHLHVATLIPGATAHTFAEAGHSAYYETPDDFNAVLGDFLSRHVSEQVTSGAAI
jgi:pimeloyl-ACP methyl ester carboxylesterase